MGEWAAAAASARQQKKANVKVTAVRALNTHKKKQNARLSMSRRLFKLFTESRVSEWFILFAACCLSKKGGRARARARPHHHKAPNAPSPSPQSTKQKQKETYAPAVVPDVHLAQAAGPNLGLCLQHPVVLRLAVAVLARAQRVRDALDRVDERARAVVRRVHLFFEFQDFFWVCVGECLGVLFGVRGK